MAVMRDLPYGAFNFLVDLGTGTVDGADGGFEEVSGLGVEVAVIEYRNGNEKRNAVRKITGRPRYPDVVLRRGLIGSLMLYSWIDEIRDGSQSATRTVSVQLQSEDRSGVVMTCR